MTRIHAAVRVALKRVAVLVSITALALTATVVGATAAQADITHNPGTWNGYIVYLSRACHDAADGVPGGPCITNTGCNGYSENSESVAMSNTTAIGAGLGWNLVERGYRAVIGTGTLNQNVANSNAIHANMHIPLHSNAQTESCTTTNAAVNGTWALYRSTNGSTCATTMASQVGALSPGTNDKKVYRTDLGEINNTTAVACYLEAEFHSWNSGVTWLDNEVDWTFRVGETVDMYFGYP